MISLRFTLLPQRVLRRGQQVSDDIAEVPFAVIAKRKFFCPPHFDFIHQSSEQHNGLYRSRRQHTPAKAQGQSPATTPCAAKAQGQSPAATPCTAKGKGQSPSRGRNRMAARGDHHCSWCRSMLQDTFIPAHLQMERSQLPKGSLVSIGSA